MVAVPDGQYHVELAVMPVEAAPRLFGYDRWLRKSFTKTATAVYLPLGTFEATAGRLGVAIPAEAGVGNHIIGLRLTPPAAAVADEVDDAILHERLKALGYVE